MGKEIDLDALILSLARPRWQKVAMIIAKTLNALGGNVDDTGDEVVATRIKALAQSGELEAQGNLSLWRYSEVRLPASKDD